MELDRLAQPTDRVIRFSMQYAEFVDGYDGGLGLADMHSNIVVTRTFPTLWPRRHAGRLGLWPQTDHGRAEPLA